MPVGLAVFSVGLLAGSATILTLSLPYVDTNPVLGFWVAVALACTIVALGNWGAAKVASRGSTNHSIGRLTLLQALATFLIPFIVTTWADRTTLLGVASIFGAAPAAILGSVLSLWILRWSGKKRGT